MNDGRGGNKAMTAYTIARMVWALLVIFTGTSFRIRDPMETSVDLLIGVQLALAGIGAALGGYLSCISGRGLGWGAKLLLTFAAFAMLSACFSDRFAISMGYALLLAGSVLLTMGIMRYSDDESQITGMERLWAFFVFAILVMMTIQIITSVKAQQMTRLGIADNFNYVAILAAMAFLLLWQKKGGAMRLLALAVLALITIGTRGRVVIAALILCCILGGYLKIGRGFRTPYVFAMAALIAFFIALGSANDWSALVTRGQSASQMGSLSGRVGIWKVAASKVTESGTHLLFGHGYCTSRFIFNTDKPLDRNYLPTHSHNIFIESLLSMGLVGELLCLLLLGYMIRLVIGYARDYSRHRRAFDIDGALIVFLILLQSLTASPIYVKVTPPTLLLIFYLLAYDARATLRPASDER